MRRPVSSLGRPPTHSPAASDGSPLDVTPSPDAAHPPLGPLCPTRRRARPDLPAVHPARRGRPTRSAAAATSNAARDGRRRPLIGLRSPAHIHLCRLSPRRHGCRRRLRRPRPGRQAPRLGAPDGRRRARRPGLPRRRRAQAGDGAPVQQGRQPARGHRSVRLLSSPGSAWGAPGADLSSAAPSCPQFCSALTPRRSASRSRAICACYLGTQTSGPPLTPHPLLRHSSESAGYIVIASVSTTAASKALEKSGGGFIRALVLDPDSVRPLAASQKQTLI